MDSIPGFVPKRRIFAEGGKGSGFFGHVGRKGRRGGSMPRTGHWSSGVLGKRKFETKEDVGYSEDYGTKPGVYVAYRAGGFRTRRRMLFFSASYGGAVIYGSGGGRGVKPYAIKIEKPFVTDDIYTGLAHFTADEASWWKERHSRSGNSVKWLRAADIKMQMLLKEEGYDAVTFMKPTPPASREIAVIPSKDNIVQVDWKPEVSENSLGFARNRF